MDKRNLDFFYFFLHFIVIIFIWTSPFYLSWKVILFFIFLYYLQLLIFGNCILTIKQFKIKNRDKSVYAYILKNLGFKFNEKNVANFVDFILPWIILLIAIYRQIILK